jgi:hypothetical protein
MQHVMLKKKGEYRWFLSARSIRYVGSVRIEKCLYIKWKQQQPQQDIQSRTFTALGQGTQWRYQSHYFSGHFLIISFDLGVWEFAQLKNFYSNR